VSKAGVRAEEPPHVSYEMSVSELLELLDAVTAPRSRGARRVIAKHLMRKTSVDESIFKMD
jgi:hypothetical protein